jgi:hypothetical protein
MVHLRIVVPSYQAGHALDLLKHTPSVVNLIYLERAAQLQISDAQLSLAPGASTTTLK